MYLNGLVLVSSILNFQTARFFIGNDLPYVLFLPTYTATAWYHKKIKGDLKKLLAEVEHFAANDYTLALMKGSGLAAADRASVIKKLAAYTGLSEDYIDRTDLRIQIHRFCKERYAINAARWGDSIRVSPALTATRQAKLFRIRSGERKSIGRVYLNVQQLCAR